MFETKDLTETRAVEMVDEGLRQYMIKIFNYMCVGLCITALGAWIGANTPLIGMMFRVNEATNTISLSALGWIITLAPLAMVIAFNVMMTRASSSSLQLMFWAFSAVMGLSMSNILIVYTASSITRVFLITAATFGAMSLYGYSTKRDLTAMGSFMMMGLWGLIIASLVNIFLQSTGLYYALSYLSVVVFVGLTAYDMQKLKSLYYSTGEDEFRNKVAISGALELYLDFINLFISLLRIMGDRR